MASNFNGMKVWILFKNTFLLPTGSNGIIIIVSYAEILVSGMTCSQLTVKPYRMI